METLIKQDPRKTKERLMIFLLIFLVLLVPLTLLSKNQRPDAVITGLHAESVNETANQIYFRLDNNLDDRVSCQIEVIYSRNGEVVKTDYQEFGLVGPKTAGTGIVVLSLPGGPFDFEVNPVCIPS